MRLYQWDKVVEWIWNKHKTHSWYLNYNIANKIIVKERKKNMNNATIKLYHPINGLTGLGSRTIRAERAKAQWETVWSYLDDVVVLDCRSLAPPADKHRQQTQAGLTSATQASQWSVSQSAYRTAVSFQYIPPQPYGSPWALVIWLAKTWTV